MNVDHIFDTFNRHHVEYLLIGGMNFLLRHEPIMTYDVDLWIEDTDDNCSRCEGALTALDAEWGPSDKEWKPVSELKPGWLRRQELYCVNSPHGAIDIFRRVPGLPDWKASFAESVLEDSKAGIAYRGISDHDMLKCQLALQPGYRKQSRIDTLRRILGEVDE